MSDPTRIIPIGRGKCAVFKCLKCKETIEQPIDLSLPFDLRNPKTGRVEIPYGWVSLGGTYWACEHCARHLSRDILDNLDPAS